MPDCLRSWLQDPDGDGLYTFTTTAIPAGSYEAKVAINESWTENYGQNGVRDGANIPFTVPANGAEIFFQYDAASHRLTILDGAPRGDLRRARAHWVSQRHDRLELGRRRRRLRPPRRRRGRPGHRSGRGPGRHAHPAHP